MGATTRYLSYAELENNICPERLRKDFGMQSSRKFFQYMGPCRGDAVLENSICPERLRKDFGMQSSRKFFQYMGPCREDAVLE